MNKWIEKFRRDSWGMGIFLGTIVPALTFAVLFGLFTAVLAIAGIEFAKMFDIDLVCKLVLLSMVPSVFIMRYYLLKLKYDYTGRGILVVTFVVAIVFCVLQFVV
ncbi:MAG: hypothetical protein MJZ49_08485 [Bacteroidales bacterium]|nr:hypothetical protein [Bacteroidales bacterium]